MYLLLSYGLELTFLWLSFLLGPVLRNVSLATRKEVISWLMPKMVFYMPTVAAVTTTAGYFLASKMGLITLNPPAVYWMWIVLLNFIRTRRMLKRAGVDIKGLFRSLSSSASMDSGQYNPIKYYCMSCGKEHREIACPNCGSKMKRVG
jgi:hypothetical protein